MSSDVKVWILVIEWIEMEEEGKFEDREILGLFVGEVKVEG